MNKKVAPPKETIKVIWGQGDIKVTKMLTCTYFLDRTSGVYFAVLKVNQNDIRIINVSPKHIASGTPIYVFDSKNLYKFD